MKITLNIPEDLMRAAVSLSKSRTKSQAVIIALQEFVHRRKVEKLLSLEGKVEFDDTWEKNRHAR
jgi:hypothetical protein